MQVRDEEIIENEPEEFDHRVTIRDPKTGVVVREQPYRMEVVAGVKRYFRDGIEYHPNGRPVNPEIYAKHLEEKRTKRKQQRFQEASILDQKSAALGEISQMKEALQSSFSEQMKELKDFRDELLEIARGLKANKDILEAKEKELQKHEVESKKVVKITDKGTV
jgi:chromosome condensin MukBEF ATPase and DNA-binding subunit MukB